MDTVVPGEGTTGRPVAGRVRAGHCVGGRYTLRTTIGTGGMGTVWRAQDEVLRRPVAVKEVSLPDGIPTAERDMLCERTLREARAAAALNHPAVIRVYDVVEDDARPWIVMELLEARSLADIVREDGPMPPKTVASIGLAVLGALETAHAAGILHRDVKPGNVLMSSEGRTTLTDFGVARSANESPLTSTGLLLGSPQYIAPERARGQAFGPASDLWSLGATLYAAVEGRAPFDQGDPLPTMTAIVAEPPAPMTLAGPLAPVLSGLLTKDPGERLDHARARAGLAAVLAEAPLPRVTTQETVPLPTGPMRTAPLPVPPHPTAPHPTATRRAALQPPARPSWATLPQRTLPQRTRPERTRPRSAPPYSAQPHGGGHPGSTPPHRRMAVLTAASVVVALLVGLGLYGLGSTLLDSSSRGNAPGRPGTAAVPATGIKLTAFDHPSGEYSVKVPAAWTQRAYGSGRYRFYDADESTFIQLSTQRTPSGSQEAVWAAAERYVERGGGDVTSYARVGSFTPATLAGRDALDWEWTFVRGKDGQQRHVIERGVIIDGVSYQLYLSTPEAQFAATRPLLDELAVTFRLSA